MEFDRTFQFTIAEVCREVVILPTDSEEEIRAKSNRGFWIAVDEDEIEERVNSWKNFLQRRIRTHSRRPKHGLRPDQVAASFKKDVLNRSNFDLLIALGAVEHPFLQEMGVEDRPLRAVLYEQAQGKITATKLAIAEEALGVDIFGACCFPPELREGPDRIAVLERFQERLIAKR